MSEQIAPKIKGAITDIKIDDASFAGTGTLIDELSLVNFFFGSNGTGKSTIADCLCDLKYVNTSVDDLYENYDVLLFNQRYIAETIKNYQNMAAVFTINSADAAAQQKEDDLNAEKKSLQDEKTGIGKSQRDLTGEYDNLDNTFDSDIWDSLTTIKSDYQKAIGRSKRAFADGVRKVQNPQDTDLADLKRLHDSAFLESSTYKKFNAISNVRVLEDISGGEILEKEIKSKATSDYATKMKNLDNASWIKTGRDAYFGDGFVDEEGHKLCPYCHQIIDNTLENDIDEAFDREYQDDMAKLRAYVQLYKTTKQTLITSLDTLPPVIYPGVEIKDYNAKLNAFKLVVEANIRLLDEKLADPKKIVQLQGTEESLQELYDVIETFNKLIEKNNTISDNQGTYQTECRNKLYAYVAFHQAAIVRKYKADRAALDAKGVQYKTRIQEINKRTGEIQTELDGMTVQVDTATAVKEINDILTDTGFTGFKMIPRTGSKYLYEVRRSDGSLATNVSEAEKNFIAFLYFYETVKGNGTALPKGSDPSNTDQDSAISAPSKHDKIVIIDDPVSSMDSSTMYVVGHLIREMVRKCMDNAIKGLNPLKQVFILTHNAYFFREITYSCLQHYRYVNIYRISKHGTESNVKLMRERDGDNPTKWNNVSPVRDSYSDLWDQYRTATSATTLINVIRRILEYYFLQMGGYDGKTLYQRILIDNEDNFDPQAYKLAGAMVSYIDTQEYRFNEGLYYSPDDTNLKPYRDTFEKIFIYMDADQHFNHMMMR